MVQDFTEALMGAEADALCGAPYGERSPGGSTGAMATANWLGTRAPARSSSPSPSCAQGATSPTGCSPHCEDPIEIEPPTADAVQAVARLLPPAYRLALVALDVTGCRVGELEAARVGDLDERQQAWLVRAAVSKTRRPRWVALPDDVWQALLERLPPRDDRDPHARLFGEATADRLRMAIARACRAAGVPHFSPHALRHRRISLLHKQGLSWAEIGDKVGQRSRVVTADTYSHVLIDPREIDRPSLLA
jgi:integrase